MKQFNKLHLTLAAIMITASLLAWVLRPTQKMSQQHAQAPLADTIPHAFGEWKEVEQPVAQFIDPTVSESLKNVYLETLSRTYTNASGQQIMLAIAYGGDQNDMMQVHKPEICYRAQGFYIDQSHDVKIDSGFGKFTVRRLIANKNQRVEPVTYWVTIGSKVAVNPLQWRIERIRYGLTGVVPDGLLFRVSSIGNNIEDGYELQVKFIQQLMKSLDEKTKARMIGIE